MRKPLGIKYVENPTTIGEKIRNRRLELGLLQKDVAEIMGVCEDTITFWENGRAIPQLNLYPKVTKFLGYFPFEIDTSTLGGKITKYRYEYGFGNAKLAKALGANERTVVNWEQNKRLPFARQMKKVLSVISDSL